MYPPSLLIKALSNILKIGMNTNRLTKIMMSQMVPTIKLSPLSHPREERPCVI